MKSRSSSRSSRQSVGAPAISEDLWPSGASSKASAFTSRHRQGLRVRAGVRVKGEIVTGAGKLQPYARFDLHRASGGRDVVRFAGPAASADIASSIGATSTELAGGFTLGLGDSTSLYGELGKLWASGGATRVQSSLQASLGLRLKW
ncbi:autotransporter domain-containing protein [Variovorax paradoxus]|nr:autotransporter domain-containing protein [Variovorax paradoxus]